MGRPCEFDRERAAEIAMRLFHEKGYEATSIEDLTTALNISRASLYNAFGDKHGLLLATFQCASKPAGALDKPGPVREVLRGFFESLVSQKRGCYFLTLGAELSTSDPDVRKRVRQSLDATRQRFEEFVQRAQAAGEVSKKADAAEIASVLLGTTVSLLTLARVHPDRNVNDAVISHALKTLDKK